MAEHIPGLEPVQSELESLLERLERTEVSGPIEGDAVNVPGFGPLPIVETMTTTETPQGRREDRLVVGNQELTRTLAWVRRASRSHIAEEPSRRLSTNHLYLLDDDSHARFENLLKRTPWTWIAPTLFELAHRWGYDLWIVGGAVRDLITGKDVAEVNDLDLSGTVPPVLFASWLRSLTELDPTTKSEGDGRQFVDFRVTQSNNDVVRLKQKDDSIVEYASLRRRHHGKSWFGGSDFERDLLFRDVRLNTLFYDWGERLLIDPSGRAVEDLGMKIENGKVTRAGKVTVVPIDSPPAAPWDWPLKAIARSAKAVWTAKRDGVPNVEPVLEWFRRNENRIKAAYADENDLGPRSLGYHMSGAFKQPSADEADDIYTSVVETIPDWFRAEVRTSLRSPITRMGLEDDSEAADLVELEGNSAPFAIGGSVVEASSTVSPQSMLKGWRRSEFDVALGNDVVRVLGVIDDEGRQFAELDDTGSLIVA